MYDGQPSNENPSTPIETQQVDYTVDNPEQVISDITQDLSDLSNEVTETASIVGDLSALNDEVLASYTLTAEEQKVVDSIDNSASFQLTETLNGYIENKEWGKVIVEFFSIIGRLFSSKNGIGYSEFNTIDLSSLKLDEKNEAELEGLINYFEKKIDDTSDIKKDLKFTYLLSNVKNKLLEKKESVTDKEELLKKNLEVGDVILLNKEVGKKDIGTKLLEAYDSNYDTDFGHAAIVIATDPLTVRHSTTETGKKSNKNGFVEETELNSYLTRCGCKGYDLLSLRPTEDIKNKILSYSEQNMGKGYDNNAAIGGGIFGKDGEGEKAVSGFSKNKGGKDDVFNCVEIIAQALDQEKLQDITHPNEFLEYMNIFKPVYLTTIKRS